MSSFRFGFFNDSDNGDAPNDTNTTKAETHAPIPSEQIVPNSDDAQLTVEYDVLDIQLLGLKVTAAALLQGRDSESVTKIAKWTDVLPGVYEGGLKVWECSMDLVQLLAASRDGEPPRSVLELGCGHALPGLYCLREHQQCRLTFQDLNESVLRTVTMKNVVANLGPEGFSRSTFLTGDWKNSLQHYKQGEFDLILSAETIYSTANYGVLHELLEHALSADGVALFAAKRYYFGVGGGTGSFAEYVAQRGRFSCKAVLRVDDGGSNVRDILEIRFRG